MPFFTPTYNGSINYYAALVRYSEVFFDPFESWQKQSYRNRFYIDAPNGKLMLSVPIDHTKSDGTYGNTFTSLDEHWRSKHWQALKTTYNLSPFFDELAPTLYETLFSEETNLFTLNLQLTTLVLSWLNADVKLTIKSKQALELRGTVDDFSETFHPKMQEKKEYPKYTQVFQHKHGFLPNLSILDLCFNEGPAAFDYLSTL